MKKRMLLCILCAVLVVISGCYFREGNSTSVEEDSVSASSNDTEVNDGGDEPSSEIDLPAGDESEIGSGTANSQVISPEPPSSPNANTTESAQEYQVMEENAEALLEYLRDNLSPEDHGGMYLEKWGLGDDGGIFLYVWTMDASALDSTLAAYTGDPFPVERLKARCSLSQLLQFNAALDSIKMGEGAYIGHALSETGNLVSITVSSTGFERISNEIKQIANNLQIPDECVFISEVRSENPVTQELEPVFKPSR